jgi:hypothetical protein
MKNIFFFLLFILLVSCRATYDSFNLDNEKKVFVQLGDSKSTYISKWKVSNYESWKSLKNN